MGKPKNLADTKQDQASFNLTFFKMKKISVVASVPDPTPWWSSQDLEKKKKNSAVKNLPPLQNCHLKHEKWFLGTPNYSLTIIIRVKNVFASGSSEGWLLAKGRWDRSEGWHQHGQCPDNRAKPCRVWAQEASCYPWAGNRVHLKPHQQGKGSQYV